MLFKSADFNIELIHLKGKLCIIEWDEKSARSGAMLKFQRMDTAPSDENFYGINDPLQAEIVTVLARALLYTVTLISFHNPYESVADALKVSISVFSDVL